MMVLINYANEAYRNAQRANTWSAYHIAKVDKVIEYSDKDIDAKFMEDNKSILSQKRGNGLWLWKPYIISKTMYGLKNGDLLFYCDSGSIFFRNIQSVRKIMESKDIWITEAPLLERQFTKKEVIDFFDANHDQILNSNQYQGGFICLRKNDRTIELVREWLKYCCNEKLISKEYDLTIQDTCFIAGREDQSILSVLAKKKGIFAYQDPTQFAKLPEIYWDLDSRIIKPSSIRMDYKPFIFLHRKSNISIKLLFSFVLYCVLPLHIGKLYLTIKRRKSL